MTRRLALWTCGLLLAACNSDLIDNRGLTVDMDISEDAGPIVDALIILDAQTVAPDERAPQVNFSYPAAQGFIVRDIDVRLEAQDDRELEVVTLQLDGVQVAEWTARPYTWRWRTEETLSGDHSLLATARDTAGNEAEARLDVIFVAPCYEGDCPPSEVRLVGPIEDSLCGDALIQAAANNDQGPMRFDMLVDGEALPDAVPGGEPLRRWDTTTVSDGAHMLTLIAWDRLDQGAVTRVEVEVNNSRVCEATPALALNGLVDGAIIGASQRVTAEVTAGIAEYVSFFVGGTLAHTDDEAPYTFEYVPTEAGRVGVAAAAFGNDGQGAVVGVYLEQDITPPIVSLVSPEPDELVSGLVHLLAETSDRSGITQVRFRLADHEEVLFEPPWEVAFDLISLPSGPQTVRLNAVDSVGLVGTNVTTVQLDRPPVLDVITPSNGAVIDGRLEVFLVAHDDLGLVSVRAFADDTPIGAPAPETCEEGCIIGWLPVQEGPVTISVVVEDTAGQRVTINRAVTVSPH